MQAYQVVEAFTDIKLYLFFLLGLVGNVPNGGISNFGTLIIKGTPTTIPCPYLHCLFFWMVQATDFPLPGVQGSASQRS